MDDNFLRQSQVVTSFGPGSLVDLPEHSIIVGGLGTWQGHALVPVHERRLERKLAQALNQQSVKLFAPPPFDDRDEQRRSAVGGYVFPTWFETQTTVAGGGGRDRRRRLVGWDGTQNGRHYIDPQEPKNQSKKRLVPVRFVCGCKRGHIDDIDWPLYVHRGEKGCSRALWIEERGTAGDVADVVVGCDCGLERRMYEARDTGVLGGCRGRRPWLGNVPWERCGQPNKLLVRTGSNTYFPQRISVISLPDGDDRLAEAVKRNWEVLGNAHTVHDVRNRRFDRVVKVELADFDDEAVLRAIQAHSVETLLPDIEPSVKAAEFEVLACGRPSFGLDGPESLFYAETLGNRAEWGGGQPGLEGVLRVVAVHRLREVIAQVGFTRIAPPETEVDGELDPAIERAALDVQHDWLPAFENRGEGVFVQLDPEWMAAWLARPQVIARAKQLEAGFAQWAAQRQSNRKFPGPAYVMVHSLAHLLLIAVAEECGYPASSLRERVYALPPGQYGVLLYTATPGADGTLGGLAACAARIGALVRRAVDLAALCSNDPICAHHAPDEAHGDRPLHGAACHGCVFVAETSCEQRNDLLDRSLVVDTLERAGAGFFLPGA